MEGELGGAKGASLHVCVQYEGLVVVHMVCAACVMGGGRVGERERVCVCVCVRARTWCM